MEFASEGSIGARRTKASGDLEADFGFTGHFVHAASGLHLALFRAYDADLGMWISRDPIEEEGGLNVYAYVANAPINYVDQSGLFGAFLGVTGSAEAGVGVAGAGATGSAAIGGFREQARLQAEVPLQIGVSMTPQHLMLRIRVIGQQVLSPEGA